MAKHTFFTYGYNGFFNGDCSKLIAGFGAQNYADIIAKNQTSPYVRTCLYKKYVGASDIREIPGILRSLSRIVIPNIGSFPEFGGYGTDKNGDFWFDYYDGDTDEFKEGDYGNHRHIIVRIGSDMRISASVIDEAGSVKSYVITTHARQSDSHSSSAVIAAIMAYFLGKTDVTAEELTIASHVQECINKYVPGPNDDFALACICAINDIYTYIAYKDSLPSQTMNVSDYDNPIFPSMSLNDMNVEFDNFTGSSKYLNAEGSARSSAAISSVPALKTVAQIMKENDFVLDPKAVLTGEEELMIPNMDSLVPDPLVVKTAQLIKGSTFLPKPFRNVKWIGETGTGKSTASQILAQFLHIPYTFMTFNPDTIISDLYVNILPSNKKSSVDMAEYSSILEMAVFSPDEAYQKLTGKEDKSATTQMVLAEIISKMSESSSDFMYVDSPLVQAYRYGWLCELQETNTASKPGVLVGINAALDDLATIKLPTGEVIKRHKNCVIVMTQNENYEGTRKTNQAVDSRMHIKGTFRLPDDNELAKRISANSGLRDLKTIKKMIEVMHAVRRVRQELGETGGACSVREIQAWAQATEILGDPHEAALTTIVPSATSDEEIIPDILAAVEKFFAPRSI